MGRSRPVRFRGRRSLLIFLICLPLPGFATAQSGSIRGQVIEAVTLQPLPGINVVVVGTQQGAATDVEGRFRIEPVVPGRYKVRASAIGFEPQAKTDVVVQPSRPTLLLIELGKPDSNSRA